MSEQSPTDDVKRFGFTYSLDRDRFFRRSCPSCGRDFKTEINDADLASSLQPAFRQMGLDIGIDQSGVTSVVPVRLHCPYCGHTAESSEMLTSVFSRYLRHYALREYVLPRMHKIVSGFTDSLSANNRRSRGGLLSLQLKVESSSTVLPPRPISGPEPPDMTPVLLLCCGSKAKIQDGWADSVFCPYCGTIVILQ